MNKKHLETAEKFFAILGLTFFSGGLLAGASINSPGLIPASVVSFVRYFVWGTSILLICVSYKRALYVISKDIFIFIFVLIVYS